MVYSRMFGAGVLMDAFLVAFKIPNFMRRLFAEGAFSQAFVPVVSEYKVQRSARRGARAGRRRHGHDGLVHVGGDDRRHRRRAAARAAVRARLPRRRRQVRPHGRHAALDLPVPALHLARGARVRRAEQLPALQRAGADVHADEPGHDRVRRVDRAAFRAARRRARRSACSWRALVQLALPAAGHGEARPAAPAALALGPRGREARSGG